MKVAWIFFLLVVLFYLQFDTLKETDLFLASLKLPAGDIITFCWADSRLQSQSGAKRKVVFPGEDLSAHKRSMVRNASCTASSPTARAAAPEEAAPLPEATPNCLNFELQSSNQPLRCQLRVKSCQALTRVSRFLGVGQLAMPIRHEPPRPLSSSDWTISATTATSMLISSAAATRRKAAFVKSRTEIWRARCYFYSCDGKLHNRLSINGHSNSHMK